MSRFGRSEPVRCLPAPRREPAFEDEGPHIPTIPQMTKTPEILMFRPEKWGSLEKSGTDGRTFSDENRSSGDGATQGSDHRLASRQAREKQETAGRDLRSAHGRGVATPYAIMLPAAADGRPRDGDRPPRCSHAPRRSDKIAPYLLKPCDGFPSGPLGIAVLRASTPRQISRQVTVLTADEPFVVGLLPHPPASRFLF
jgi:hypothetical protein